jgi:hypothetical protein
MNGQGARRWPSNARCRYLPASLLAVLALVTGAAPADLDKRWVYLATNPSDPTRVGEAVSVIRRAAASGYNGIVLAGWDRARQSDVKSSAGLDRIRSVAAEVGVEIVPALFPIGDSRGLLAEDPNLAEAVPVRDALFVVRNGIAHLEAGPPLQLKATVMERLREAGRDAVPDRLARTVRVTPFRQYHVHVQVKSRELDGRAKIVASAGRRALIFNEPDVQRSQDWTEVHAAFDSLDNQEVELQFACSRCRSGSLWWRDPQVEEIGLLNVVRREGAPLVVRQEGGGVLKEGRDYAPIVDPRMGTVPSLGRYEVWHEPPAIRAPKLAEGTRLRVSYYHAVVFARGKVMICPSEPKTLELLRRQAGRAHALWHARTYFMNHDEVRVLGWDRSCARRRLTPGAVLADNVRQCVRILRELDPDAEIYVWSDMFDPNHNALAGYYLVNGDLYGAWEGLDRKVVVALWRFDRRDQSLAWFAARGQPMLIAGYYDGDPAAMRQWLESARAIRGVRGVMYTTWQDRYEDLERFAEVLRAGRK